MSLILFKILLDIETNSKNVKIHEEYLIRFTLSRLIPRLNHKFPRYRWDIEDILQEHALLIPNIAINFVAKHCPSSSSTASIVRHWLNLNFRILVFDMLDKLRSKARKKEISMEENLYPNSHLTIKDQVAFAYSINYSCEDNSLDIYRRRFDEVIKNPKFQKPLSRKYTQVTVSNFVRKRLAKKSLNDIAIEWDIPLGSLSSIWSRSIRHQLKQELSDLDGFQSN